MKPNYAKRNRNSVQENPLSRRNSAVLYAANASSSSRRKAYAERDAFDDYLDAERSHPAPRRKKTEPGKSKPNVMTYALLAALLVFVALGVWRVSEYRAFAEMKRLVSNQQFYSGTKVEDIDVSQMTLEEAMEYWNSQIEPAHRDAAAVLNDGTRLTAEQLGYYSDYEMVLRSAWNAGRSGSLEERYQRISAQAQSPTSYSVNRKLYDDAVVREYAKTLAQQIDQSPKDASIKSFNTESYAFEFNKEQPGYTLDQEALISSLETVLQAGGGKVDLKIATLAPKTTVANVQSQYGMISYAVTNASSSSKNRLNNIKLALSLINGYCVEPGASFSFNGVVGERTKARGFREATAYSSGEVIEDVGGGICQVSTTLFNAAVKANMEIVERHPHSLTVGYVDLGKDAAVNWGSQDLRFTNPTDEKIYICCYLTDDKRVRFGIFGKLLSDGMTITLEGEKTGTIDSETQYQLNMTLGTGQTNVVQEGKNGYTATTYKIYWDANGNEIKREQLCKSSYRSRATIIEYGP